MRCIEDQQIALACLQLAHGGGIACAPAATVISDARAYYAFVTGKDTDDAKAKLDAVREVINAE